MDNNECNTAISASRNVSGKTIEQILTEMNDVGAKFGKAAAEKFGKKGEW